MNVLLMLIGVLIVYLAIKLVFRYNWNKGLGVALEFEKKHVVNGETVNVVEVISNEKRLPLPCVNLKFQVDRELEFPGTDTNSSVSDLTYRMCSHFWLIRELQEEFLLNAITEVCSKYQAYSLHLPDHL